jgi:hypothetical protein
MHQLFSEMPIAPAAGAMRGIRTAFCRRSALIAVVLVCGMLSPASASVEARAATGLNGPASRHTRWMLAQAPLVDPDKQDRSRGRPTRIDPDTQGGAPIAPPPAAPEYRVAGVASNDVLNIRSGPDASSAIVSTIPPYGSGILMTGSCAGQWCPIDYRGSQGWVNRRYLTSQ